MSEACPLRTEVRRCLLELPAGSTGVVAVSGGPDSVALLHALLLVGWHALKGRENLIALRGPHAPSGRATLPPLVVAHLNHQLRGDESDADEAFVRELHGRLVASGTDLLPLRCERVDVRTAAAGDNLESAARRLRYDWLTKVAREDSASWVATGHTADDQAETVLHRLVRGTGLRGLAGMPRRRELAPGIALVRPLLSVRRSEVLTFLQVLDQPFCQDSSNFDRHYTRSRLRHDLLPFLAEQFNPAIVEVLANLAEQAGEAHALIETQAAKLLANAELPRAGATVVLDARRLTSESAVLAREALRLLWQRESWPLGEMGFADWQRVMEVAQRESTAVDLPGRVRVRRVGHVLQIVKC